MNDASVRDEVDHARASDLEAVVRPVAAACLAGAVVGILVGGIGGRLAMALLAALNREDHGLLTDDGFTIGQFTGATVNLTVTSGSPAITSVFVTSAPTAPDWPVRGIVNPFSAG